MDTGFAQEVGECGRASIRMRFARHSDLLWTAVPESVGVVPSRNRNNSSGEPPQRARQPAGCRASRPLLTQEGSSRPHSPAR
jgi:hypothetical protein